MLRVGLTGGLGSGKSTVARMLAEMGARVIEADALGRELMRPGELVYGEIVQQFGLKVVTGGVPGGELNRRALARIAFEDGRVEELNAIVHPAVIKRETEMTREIALKSPAAVVVVESALLFETKYGGKGGWRQRFDRVVLVRAEEERKVARYVARGLEREEVLGLERVRELEVEARQRLERQIGDDAKAELVDYVLTNDWGMAQLEWQVDQLWEKLTGEAAIR